MNFCTQGLIKAEFCKYGQNKWLFTLFNSTKLNFYKATPFFVYQNYNDSLNTDISSLPIF